MPDDSNEIEKQLKEITGASVSQIRAAALGTPLRDAITRGQSNAPTPHAAVATPPPPQIQVTDQGFEPRAFRTPTVATQAGNGRGIGGTLAVIVIQDGFPFFATISGNIIGPVEDA